MTKQRISDPQQWNLYAYSRNSPLKYVDPDGHELKLAIYSGKLPPNVAKASADYMVSKLQTAGVKNVSYEMKSGSPRGWEVFKYQMLPTQHSELVEMRPSKSGQPAFPPLEGGHNWGGPTAVDTSVITSQTNDPATQAIGIGKSRSS